jgi:hypothetical protein
MRRATVRPLDASGGRRKHVRDPDVVTEAYEPAREQVLKKF